MQGKKTEGDSFKRARQIEILSLVEKNPNRFSVADLCHSCRVEVATIQRDLRDLRESGFDIHSSRNRLILFKDLTEKDYRILLSNYLTSVNGIISFPKNISLTVKQLKGKTLDIFTTLVAAIQTREKIEIKYMRHQDSLLSNYTIAPYDIIPGNRDWRLIAVSEGVFKQFIIGGIKEIKKTGINFRRAREYSADDYYAGSFGFFSGRNVFDVVLKFTKNVASVVANRTWSEDQTIVTNGDRSVTLKMAVNSIEEVGNWILPWGNEVKILEPVELKKYVIEKASGILKTNPR